MEKAIESGDLTQVKSFFENKHYSDDIYHSALWLACEKGHVDIVKYLVEEVLVNLHACNEYALNIACMSGHLEVVKYLVKEGADIFNEEDAVFFASENGHKEIVKFLVECGLHELWLI